MEPPQYYLGEVYGTSRKVPHTYTVREPLDERFLAALADDKHIVLYGGSRQGKSSLIRKYLQSDSCCVIQCSFDQKRYDIYRMLLREAGASVAVERKKKRARGIGARISVVSGDLRSDSEMTERTIDIDLANINDVLRVTVDNGFTKTVVVEDFHYLSEGTQQNIAEDLKVVYEKTPLQVIIMGAWEEENRLVNLNGDLAGRLSSIHVGAWDEQSLAHAVMVGEGLLNFSLSDKLRNRLISHAEGSIGLLQELCYSLCAAAGIYSTLDRRAELDDPALVDNALERVVATNSARFRRFIATYSTHRKRYGGRRVWNKWIMRCLLTTDPEKLLAGLSSTDMFEAIRELYPRETSRIDYSEARLLKQLRKTWSVQRDLGIQPTTLAFNSATETLDIVDRSFVLFVRNSNPDQLFRYLPDGGRDTDEFEEDTYPNRGRQLIVPT